VLKTLFREIAAYETSIVLSIVHGHFVCWNQLGSDKEGLEQFQGRREA
jgi:hypothetical protein